MKRSPLLVIVLAMILTGCFRTGPNEFDEEVYSYDISTPEPMKEIEFQDEGFKNYIKEYLQLDDVIYWKDVANIREMHFYSILEFDESIQIESLIDLKWFINLEMLAIVEDDPVKCDFSDLSGCSNLWEVYLSNAQITGDLSDISELTNISCLLLENTDITGDLSDLRKLKNLQRLNLSNTNITGDICNLIGLGMFDELYLVNTDVYDSSNCLGELIQFADSDFSGTQVE